MPLSSNPEAPLVSYSALLRRLLGKPDPRPAKRSDFPPMRVIRLGRELTRGEAA